MTGPRSVPPTSRQVQPITKESQAHPGPQVACPCRCGTVGVLRRKVMKDGLAHVHRCPCNRCQGGRNRRRGQESASDWRQEAGVPSARWKGRNANEETWADDEYRYEHKNDGLNARPVASAYKRTRAQSDTAKAIGDPRPFVMATSYDGLKLATVEARVWRQMRAELAQLRALAAENAS